MTFSDLEIRLSEASLEFDAIAEADIRAAHGEVVDRPGLTGIPEYIYTALMHSSDEDQKAYDAEVASQIRASGDY